MPRKEYEYHFIYKTTCLLNETYYVGMHSTSDLEDGYLGSGKRLRYSVKKHGKENFKREILEYFETKDLLKKREAELVNDELLKDPLCINLQHGGGGGFSSEEHKKKCITAGLCSQWNNPIYVDNHKRKFAENVKKWRTEGKFDNNKTKGFTDKHHSENAKQLIGIASKINQAGVRNSQHGKRWITNEKENKSIYREDIIPDGWRLGRKIKI